MQLHYNATGPDRKELVGVISKTLGMKPVYKGMWQCSAATVRAWRPIPGHTRRSS